MKGWRNVTLSDISMAIDYGYTASSSNINIGPKFLRITDIAKSNIIDWNSVPFCSISQADNEKYKLYSGDIVIARTGASTGATYTIKDTDPKELVFASYLIRYKIDPKIANANLVGKFLRSKNWNEYVSGVVGGSAQPGANAKVLGAYSFLLPPLPEQSAIAAVLSSLDDKIDLLHRQNATLEAMAETLFRQWFVVEAKEEWEEKRLSDVIKLVGGGTPKTSITNYWGGTIPWLSGGDIACNHKNFIFSSEKYITEEGLNNSSAQLVPQYATIITARGTVGKFCLTGTPMSFSQTNYGILPKYSKTFFFNFLLVDYIINTLQASAYGSVFDTITSRLFDEVKISLPSQNIIEKFDSNISLYFEKIFSNQTQIRTLEKLRDTLLPKLMNGEVRVDY